MKVNYTKEDSHKDLSFLVDQISIILENYYKNIHHESRLDDSGKTIVIGRVFNVYLHQQERRINTKILKLEQLLESSND